MNTEQPVVRVPVLNSASAAAERQRDNELHPAQLHWTMLR
jgi:hypothetical protein